MSKIVAIRVAPPAALWLLFTGIAWAGPSFDCAQTPLPIEQAICGNAEVGALEGQMTGLYQQALGAADPAQADRLRLEMGRWLAHLTRDCGLPSSGALDAAAIDRAAPCLADKYRARIASLQGAAEADPAADPAADPVRAEGPAFDAAAGDKAMPAAAPSAEAAPSETPPPAAEATTAPSASTQPETATPDGWKAVPYGSGLVAIIAQLESDGAPGTASIYCDSSFKPQIPVFLYRRGGAVPTPAEVAGLNKTLEGMTLRVDGRAVQAVGRRDLGRSFSGLQLLGDGTLSYMLLIDPARLEAILHGDALEAVLNLPEGTAAGLAVQHFRL
jgi:uncharacterized protein